LANQEQSFWHSVPFARIGSWAHLLSFSAIKQLYIIQNVRASGPAEVTLDYFGTLLHKP
jgi:hypothetical protein